MLKKRKIWVLPDNDIASFPFSESTPTAKKGYIYEADAYINPMVEDSNSGIVGLAGIANRIRVDRKDLHIKPAVVTKGNTSSGTVIPDSYTAKAYCFIKKPTIDIQAPLAVSTEMGDIDNASFTVVYQNLPGGFTNSTVKIQSVTNPSIFYSNGFTSDDSETFNWYPTYGTATPIAEGEQYTLWAEPNSGTMTQIGEPLYFYAQQTLVVDFHSSTTATPTYTWSTSSVPSTAYHYTTTDSPCWVFSANTMASADGVKGYIEWMADLYALETTYKDYRPWEIR